MHISYLRVWTTVISELTSWRTGSSLHASPSCGRLLDDADAVELLGGGVGGGGGGGVDLDHGAVRCRRSGGSSRACGVATHVTRRLNCSDNRRLAAGNHFLHLVPNDASAARYGAAVASTFARRRARAAAAFLLSMMTSAANGCLNKGGALWPAVGVLIRRRDVGRLRDELDAGVRLVVLLVICS